jgi:hypothetical protein
LSIPAAIAHDLETDGGSATISRRSRSRACGSQRRGGGRWRGRANECSTDIRIWALEDLERITASVGQVGPRTGPGKRNKQQKEWYVLRRFLEKAIPADIFKLPIAGRNGCPGIEPDFVFMRAGTTNVVGLVEITEATGETDQRERTAFEHSGKSMMLLGAFGGRFSGGAARPGLTWVSDIVDAIKRKKGKVIFEHSPAHRHLIVYPNSNASLLLSDEGGEDEQEAIRDLREAIDRAAGLAQTRMDAQSTFWKQPHLYRCPRTMTVLRGD